MEKRVLSKENASRIIASRKGNFITQPGRYENIKVTGVTPFHRAVENGADQVAIINLSAITPWHVEEIKKDMGKGNAIGGENEHYQSAANRQMTANARATDYIPQKGEMVDIQVVEITTKDGNLGLFVQGIFKSAAKKTVSADLSFLDEEGTGVDILEETPAFGTTEA